MDWQSTPYILLLFFAAFTGGAWTLYGLWTIRRHNRTPTVVAFTALSLSAAIWAGMYAIQVATPTLDGKLLAYGVLHVGAVFVPPAWLAFAMSYAGHGDLLTRRTVAGIVALPVALLVALPTNPYSLALTDATLVTSGSLTLLVTGNGPLYLLYLAYAYLIIALGIGIIVAESVRSGRQVRVQGALMIVGATVPLTVNVFRVLDLGVFGQLMSINLTPVSLLVSTVLFGIAVFRYQLLDLTPIAAEVVVEQLSDGIVVLNRDESIVDANPAAAALLTAAVHHNSPDDTPAGHRPHNSAEALDQLIGTSLSTHLAAYDGVDARDRTTDWRAAVTTAGETTADTDASEPIDDGPSDDESLEGPSDDESLEGGSEDRLGTDSMMLTKPRGADDPVVIRLTRSPLTRDGTRYGWVVLLQDVTELETKRRELEQQNERLDAFAAIVSHDLRNPLAIIDGYVELMRETGDLEHLDVIDRTADRMADFLADLLQLSQRGKTVTEPQALPLAPIVDDVGRAVADEQLTVTVETELTIVADHRRLRQVFDNLFRNARDHADGPVTVRVGRLADGFFIEDDGPGISPDEAERVFDVGFTTRNDGTGFGLAIVHDIVAAHGWSITATAGETGGARFEITGVESVDETDTAGDSGGADTTEGSDTGNGADTGDGADPTRDPTDTLDGSPECR